MSPSYRPPDPLGNSDSESNVEYVPSRVDKGKGKAEGIILMHTELSQKLSRMALPGPLQKQENISHYRNSHHIHSQIIDVSSSELDKDASDDDESVYQSVDEGSDQVCSLNLFLTKISNSISDRQMDIDALPLQRDEMDLVLSVKGMYRILDLISEQGSGGLGEFLTQNRACFPSIDLSSVDKIIISQDSLAAFINSVCPGAHVSITKVNFKALDNYVIKPVGVYGSKGEITRFLLRLGAIDDTMYVISSENVHPA